MAADERRRFPRVQVPMYYRPARFFGPRKPAHDVSRGGIRAIVEEPLKAGGEYELIVGDAEESARKVAVVWVQDEADGQIVGVRYLDVEGSVPPENA